MKKHELAERIADLVMREIDDKSPIERSRSFLPISTNEKIRPGATAHILARTQIPFRGDRLAIGGLCAPSFTIDWIRIGCMNQGAASGSMPADAFATRLDLLPFLDAQLQKNGVVEIRISKRAEECFGQPLAMPMCRIGEDIIMDVTNIGSEPMPFYGVILGDEERHRF